MDPYFFDESSGRWLYGNGDEAYAWDETSGEWVDAGANGRATLSMYNWDSGAAEQTPNAGGSAGGGDPMGEWQTNYGTAGRQGITPFDTNKVDVMGEQNRLAARDWWNVLDQDTRDAQNRYQDAEQNFQRRSMSSYDPILRGQGGFTPEEQANLIQRERILGGVATEPELQDLNMAEWERNMVLGDPFGPIREAQGSLAGLRSDVDAGAESVRRVYGDYGNRLPGFIDPSRLQQSESFDPQQQSYIDDAAESYAQVIDPNRLGLSQDYLDRYDWTPRDTQDLMDRQAGTVANRGKAYRDYIERTAAESGNYSPEAIAAGFARTKAGEDSTAAQAMLDARIQGRNRELDITGERERMRLDTERDYTNRMQDAVDSITGMRLNQGQAAEQMRLAAEQGLSDRLVSGYGNQAQMAMGAEQGIGNAYRDIGTYGTGVIYDAARYGDTAMRQGGQQAFQNRTGAQTQAMNTRFGQAMDTSNALRSGYGQVYGQRKAEEAEGRNYLSGQQNAATNAAQAVRGQRIAGAGTGIGGVNEATNLVIGTKYIPTALEKGVGLAIGALSAGAKK